MPVCPLPGCPFSWDSIMPGIAVRHLAMTQSSLPLASSIALWEAHKQLSSTENSTGLQTEGFLGVSWTNCKYSIHLPTPFSPWFVRIALSMKQNGALLTFLGGSLLCPYVQKEWITGNVYLAKVFSFKKWSGGRFKKGAWNSSGYYWLNNWLCLHSTWWWNLKSKH